MPYIKQDDRAMFDPFIDRLSGISKFAFILVGVSICIVPYPTEEKLMNLSELRKIFKENELRRYQVFPGGRKIVLTFDNDHTLSIEIDGHPGINYEWDESILVKVDGSMIART